MMKHCIADAGKGVGMKSLSPKEAAEILKDMKVKFKIPKAAMTQQKRNIALDMAIEALNRPEIPDSWVDAIPVPWIEAEIKKLRDLDFEFATMTAGQIEAMLKKWRKEQEG